MLKSEFLIYRYSGNLIVPKRLPINPTTLALAERSIEIFSSSTGQRQKELDEKLFELEGESPDYKVKRGLAHILKSGFSNFEIVSPIEPGLLREKVFETAAKLPPIRENKTKTIEIVASLLSEQLNREVLSLEIEAGLYADLIENRILSEFTIPTAEELLHRYNLSQVQGVFYKATQVVVNAYRNDPGEYKLLFRYLKLFQLMSYIEGDVDTGFTITIDGPMSLFKASTRYGLALAKLLPALLHVSKWSLAAQLQTRDFNTGNLKKSSFNLDQKCGLVTHYPKNKTYDSLLEAAFAQKWAKLKTEWRLEREVELIPLPGSVMIPDFRIVHPDGREYLLEIVGYWRPEYLKKKFYQVKTANLDRLILAISERLNLAQARVNFENTPSKIIWFKDKLLPKSILKLLD